ncbi:MAG: nuclear transport factor 2 family protein [Acidobacteriota bacterium]
MKQLLVTGTTLLAGLLLSTGVQAGDVEDIIALEQGHYLARNNGDVDTWVQYHLPERDGFGPGGGLLSQGTSAEEEKRSLNAQLDAGMKYNHRLIHVEVKIFGDTAITTGYVVGSATSPDGTTSQAMMRRTGVVIKLNSQWKELHNHLSPVVAPQ